MTAIHNPTAIAAPERASFEVRRLGPGSARDINTRGEIVGVVDDEAAVWRRGTLSRLPNPMGGPAAADSINGHGVIAGRAGDGPEAKAAIVEADRIHEVTRRDVTEGNPDLQAAAAGLHLAPPDEA